MVLNGRGPRAVLGCIETVACCLPPSSLPFIDQVVPVQQKELERNNGIHLWYHDIRVFVKQPNFGTNSRFCSLSVFFPCQRLHVIALPTRPVEPSVSKESL